MMMETQRLKIGDALLSDLAQIDRGGDGEFKFQVQRNQVLVVYEPTEEETTVELDLIADVGDEPVQTFFTVSNDVLFLKPDISLFGVNGVVSVSIVAGSENTLFSLIMIA